MNPTLVGLGIVGVVAAVAVAISVVDFSSLTRDFTARQRTDVAIYFGGEKSAPPANERVPEIIHDR